MAKRSEEVERPSYAYYLRHVRDDYERLAEGIGLELPGMDRPDALTHLYRTARPGTPIARYLAWLHGRERAEDWVRQHTTPTEPTAEMWRAFWAHQRELTGKEHSIDLLAIAPWWWSEHGIINWPLDAGHYHQPADGNDSNDSEAPPEYVLAHLSSDVTERYPAGGPRSGDMGAGVAGVGGGPAPARPPTARPASFTPSSLAITSDKFTQLVLQASWDAANRDFTRWTRQYTAPPYYRDDEERMLYVSDAPVSAAAATVLSPEQEAAYWDTVLSLDDDKVSAFIIGIGKWFADRGDMNLRDELGNPIFAKTRIHVNDILGFQGIKPHHKGGYRREQKTKVAEDVWTLNRIFITGPQVIYEKDRKGRRREKQVTVHSRLLDVSLESEHDLLGDEHPYAFNLAPGDWARPYVGHDGRMVAQLLRPVMEFDPRQGVGLKAMRLGLYLSFQWRIRSSRANYDQTWAVRTLLDGARIPIETDSRLYTRFRDQVEAALDQLQARGVIKGWQYDRGDEDTLPTRGWFKPWLNWTVAMTPPATVVEHYARIFPAAQKAIAAAAGKEGRQARR